MSTFTLTAEDVAAIRRSILPAFALARRYRASQQLIEVIRKPRQYADAHGYERTIKGLNKREWHGKGGPGVSRR